MNHAAIASLRRHVCRRLYTPSPPLPVTQVYYFVQVEEAAEAPEIAKGLEAVTLHVLEGRAVDANLFG